MVCRLRRDLALHGVGDSVDRQGGDRPTPRQNEVCAPADKLAKFGWSTLHYLCYLLFKSESTIPHDFRRCSGCGVCL